MFLSFQPSKLIIYLQILDKVSNLLMSILAVVVQGNKKKYSILFHMKIFFFCFCFCFPSRQSREEETRGTEQIKILEPKKKTVASPTAAQASYLDRLLNSIFLFQFKSTHFNFLYIYLHGGSVSSA